MRFQPTPGQIEWLGILLILGTFLQFLTGLLRFAEKAWKFVNKVINDCQRRKELKAKRQTRQIARAMAKQVPMPKPAIGAERFPTKNSDTRTKGREASKFDLGGGKDHRPNPSQRPR